MKLVPKVIIGISIFAGGMWLVQYSVQQMLQTSMRLSSPKNGAYFDRNCCHRATAFENEDLNPPNR